MTYRAVISPMSDARELLGLYYRSARRTVKTYGVRPLHVLGHLNDSPVFVVGSPRSGTTFTAKTIGAVQGFVDLGELAPLKRAIPELVTHPSHEVVRTVRTVISRSQRLGQAADRRVIEQTPESTFVIDAIADAFPRARFVHLVRDGRDVASSLLGLGWLSASSSHSVDDVGHTFGHSTRFWVEDDRRHEFETSSEATRAAWVWRRYESEARTQLERFPDRTLEVRYDSLVSDPDTVARRLSSFLDAEDRAEQFVAGFARTVTTSSGRWKHDLDADQLRDILTESGGLLRALGYA